MYTGQELMKQLAEMGLQPTDAVMIHASMKAIGAVDGGAEAVLDALTAYFAPGLLMLPAHTWAQMNRTYNVFDPAKEPACVGILPNLFLKRPGVVRSLHPTHSIAAYGKNAAAYCAGEEHVKTPCAPEGCWGRLYTTKAKVLLVGVTHVRNTYIHAVEEMLDVPHRIDTEPTEFYVVMPDGTKKPVPQYRHIDPPTGYVSDRFDKMLQGYFETGAAVKGKLGDADCILCDCEKLYRVTQRVLAHEINAFLDREEIPEQWWKEQA